MTDSAAGQFYEDHERDMTDPEYAQAYRAAEAEVSAAPRVCPQCEGNWPGCRSCQASTSAAKCEYCGRDPLVCKKHSSYAEAVLAPLVLTPEDEEKIQDLLDG